MSTVDKALETQLKNIQQRTGKSLTELYTVLGQSGLTKHGALRDLLKGELDMGHGDANTVVHMYLRSDDGSTAPAAAPAIDDVLDGLYSGPKAELRPIHERLMAEVAAFGPFEIAPKKSYVSLRRRKQFAMIGPATKTQVEVGLNSRSLEGSDRLVTLSPGGMCQFKVRLAEPGQVDDELIGWLREAYEGAG